MVKINKNKDNKNRKRICLKLADIFFLLMISLLIFPVSAPAINEAKDITKEELVLSLEECIDLALKRNLDIIVEKINPRIQEMEIVKEKAVFDPFLTLELRNSETINRSTSIISGAGRQKWIGRFLGWEDNLEQESFDFNASLAKKIITGGQCELKFTNNRFATNSFYQYNDKTYLSTVTFSLFQPLLRNFGINFNKTKIKIASNNRDISTDDLKLKITVIISELQEIYWDLVATIEELKVRYQSLELARNLLERNNALVEAGRLAPVAILQAETGVASRKEGVLLAKNAAITAQDRLKRTIDLLGDPYQSDTSIVPSETPRFIEKKIDLAESFKTALNNRSDFNQARIALANQRLIFDSAKNQLLPKLDLMASYSMNGTDSGYRRNLDDLSEGDKYSWEAGILLEVPLGNRWAKSQYSQEKMRISMAEIELNDLKKNIFLEVKETAREIETNRERIKVTQSARILAEKKLKAEEERFKLGRSTTTDLLKFQEELSQAKSNENRALIDYQKSLVRWEAATGQSLKKHYIEIASH